MSGDVFQLSAERVTCEDGEYNERNKPSTRQLAPDAICLTGHELVGTDDLLDTNITRLAMPHARTLLLEFFSDIILHI